MARRESIIIRPHLNDCGGNLSKAWYVEWKWRIPGVPEMQRGRHYKDLNKGTRIARLKVAVKVIQEINDWFNRGEHLEGGPRMIYSDQIQYRNEAKMYGIKKQSVITTRTFLSEFLTKTKAQVNSKSYESYVSKLRIFNAWLELNKLNEIGVAYLEKKHIMDFFIWLNNERSLARATVDKYQQILHAFFRFLLDEKEVIISNPVPSNVKIGRVVDQAPIPIQSGDIEKLRAIIHENDQQLWLACQIQYYCAIRPGTELRLMKLQWIDWDRSLIRIPAPEAKNSLTQNVKMPSALINEMKDVYMLHTIKNKNLFVFGKDGRPGPEPLGMNTMRNRFNKFRDELNLSKQYKFYSWKHTGAINASENGMNPYDLQNHLRHSSLEITQKYLSKRKGNDEKDIDPFFQKI